LVGPRGRHDRMRQAYRHGEAPRQLTLDTSGSSRRRWVSQHTGGLPCHRRVTHSRNHARTRRQSKSSTGGNWRNRWDTGGHDLRRVWDRASLPSQIASTRLSLARVLLYVWRVNAGRRYRAR
jgi:hypothetical protein